VGLGHAALYVFVLAPLINALGHWRVGERFEDQRGIPPADLVSHHSRVLAFSNIVVRESPRCAQ